MCNQLGRSTGVTSEDTLQVCKVLGHSTGPELLDQSQIMNQILTIFDPLRV